MWRCVILCLMSIFSHKTQRDESHMKKLYEESSKWSLIELHYSFDHSKDERDVSRLFLRRCITCFLVYLRSTSFCYNIFARKHARHEYISARIITRRNKNQMFLKIRDTFESIFSSAFLIIARVCLRSW